MLQAFQSIKEEQMRLEAKLEKAVSTVAMLGKKWQDGDIDLGQGDYAKERNTLLDKEMQLMTSISVLRTMGSQIAGRWSDNVVLGSRETFDDWAYVDAAIRCYPELAHAKNSV